MQTICGLVEVRHVGAMFYWWDVLSAFLFGGLVLGIVWAAFALRANEIMFDDEIEELDKDE